LLAVASTDWNKSTEASPGANLTFFDTSDTFGIWKNFILFNFIFKLEKI
jgi:hypothetical protein